MIPALSQNTQAILLLTAPLISGRATVSQDLLSPGELMRLARYLREIQRKLADLLSPDAAELMRICQPIIDVARLQRLLGRGFLLSQVIERWQARALWVVSLADAEYPRRLKKHMRNDAPPLIYGCGDMSLLDSGGLAVVGSRRVDDALISYTNEVGQLAASAGLTLITGGVKGIDLAAMRGALEFGGTVSGVLADSLEKSTMDREHRNFLLDGRLLLLSPYDPCAGMNVDNTMLRNRLIYALADATLVVNSDLNKGTTWTGAIEQLDSHEFVPVYVRSTGRLTPGLDALRSEGAIPWPNPKDSDALKAVVVTSRPDQATSHKLGLTLFSGEGQADLAPMSSSIPDTNCRLGESGEPLMPTTGISPHELAEQISDPAPSTVEKTKALAVKTRPEAVAPSTPADTLFAVVRELMVPMLKVPMKDVEVASALNVSIAQARVWLQRLTEEGLIEKYKNRAVYVIRNEMLFRQLWLPSGQFPDPEDNA